MSGLRSGAVRFRAYPQDHEPRHVHGFIGGGEVIVDLRSDGSVALADRKDCVNRVTVSEVRKVLAEAAESFSALVAAWDQMHVVPLPITLPRKRKKKE